MDFKVEKLSKSKIKFHITMSGEEIAHFFDIASERIAKELKIDGFRPGKVPADVAKGMVDEHAIEHEAQDLAINDSYFQLMTKENLVPVARPENIKINAFDKAGGLDWEGEFDILPEIDVENWQDKLKNKGEKIKLEDVKVEQKEIDDTVNNLQKQFAKLEDKEGKTEKGDWVSIDIDIAESEKEKFDPEMLAKFKSNGFTLVIGEANFIPGFEKNLIGNEKGTEKEFDSTFPDNYHEKKLAGQKVKFKVKINEVKKLVLPEIDGEFVKNFGFEKPDDLRKAIEQDIQARKSEMSKAKFEDEVLRTLIDGIDVDVPESLIEQEKDAIVGRFVHDLEHHKGIQFSDYLASLGKNEKEFRDGFSEHAVFNVKTGLVIGQIAKNEKIDVGDKDIEEAMSVDIVNQTAGLPPEKVKEFEDKIRERYKDDEFINSIKNSILARKSIDLIVDALNKK